MNEKPVKRRGPDGGQSRQSQTFPSVHTSRSKYVLVQKKNVSDEPGFCQPYKQTKISANV